MRFEEVVDLCGGRVARTQVREASAHLCRTGQLDRICEGVYQWAHGVRRRPAALTQPPTIPRQDVTPPIDQPTSALAEPVVEELFARLFPHGVRMTPKVLRDLQQWTELTHAIAAYADSQPQ
jgi:hypothetical protein